MGKIIGFVSSLISALFIFLLFVKYNIDLEPYYFLSFAAAVFIGYRFANKFFILDQEYKVKTEKIEEDTNLLKNELDRNRQETEQLDWRLARHSNLSSIIEKFSSSLSCESVIEIIVENTYKIFGKSDRILFFLVDTKKQELELTYSKKVGITPYIKMKNGDIFDRWVFKKRQPLLVQDIYNDFRFSLENQSLDKGFYSIISAPLMSKDKVLGILRMDSAQKSFYTQEDLRLLDIISDLASVALENTILYRRVSDLAITDGLTSLYVHKYFKERLANEVKRSLKSGKPFSLALLDID
ncbi:MAG: GAF domain-containing protein, partial [Candidatus Omnitrophica bacterium]|nr:GAF domain-containing protein [Candidatus Omnitrophota bacterium]